MKKILTLVEAKSAVGSSPDNLRETLTSFAYAWFGKFCPGITIVLSKEWALDANGKPVAPWAYYSVHDPEIPAAMNWDFCASRVYLYPIKGLRKSRAGRPVVEMAENCASATDWLICADWGGASKTRGRADILWSGKEAYEELGIRYAHRASSEGNGLGSDYYIVPKTWRAPIYDPDIDGENLANSEATRDIAHENWVAEKCAEIDAKTAEIDAESERIWDALYSPDGSGARFVAEHEAKILDIKQRAAKLRFKLGPELRETYFTFAFKDYPYTEANLRAIDYDVSVREFVESRMPEDQRSCYMSEETLNRAEEVADALREKFPEYIRGNNLNLEKRFMYEEA